MSAGIIAGSVGGGLFILVASAVGLVFILRQTRQTLSVPPQVGKMDGTRLPGSPGSAPPFYGNFPAVQQQPVTDLYQLPN